VVDRTQSPALFLQNSSLDSSANIPTLPNTGVILWSRLRGTGTSEEEVRASSTNVNDYPEFMALYEKENLAAEAACRRKKIKTKQTAKKKCDVQNDQPQAT
jgi:hypothetical protein